MVQVDGRLDGDWFGLVGVLDQLVDDLLLGNDGDHLWLERSWLLDLELGGYLLASRELVSGWLLLLRLGGLNLLLLSENSLLLLGNQGLLLLLEQRGLSLLLLNS